MPVDVTNIRRMIAAPIDQMMTVFVSASIKSRNQHLRRRLYSAIDRCQNTLVYSRIKTEHYITDSRDKVIGRGLYCTGEYDFDKFLLALKLVAGQPDHRDPHLLIDIGANIGSICIPAVNRGHVGRAIAIEPNPHNVKLLTANVALNGLAGQIVVHPCALGAVDGETVEMEISDANFGDHKIRVETAPRAGGATDPATVRVLSRTLDALCVPDREARALIWIDTQGYEGHVLTGARNWLGLGLPVCAEFHPQLMKRARSFALLKACFTDYAGFYDLRHPDRFRPLRDLDAVYGELGETGKYTDVLMLARAPGQSSNSDGGDGSLRL